MFVGDNCARALRYQKPNQAIKENIGGLLFKGGPPMQMTIQTNESD